MTRSYSWSSKKAKVALDERGVAFDDAPSVLEHPETLVFEDVRRDYGASRMIAMGPLAGRLLVIVYTERPNTIRIISMRKANRREKANYQEQLGAHRRDEG